MAVIRRHEDGRYDWRCDSCGRVTLGHGPHRGPRRSRCRTCQNVRDYARRVPFAERQRETVSSLRYRGWLRHPDAGEGVG